MIQEISDLTQRLEHGSTVDEVNSAYEAHEFPQLARKESQMAMVKAVERIGKSAVINQVLAAECAGSEKNLDDIGFKALMTTLSNESYRTEEIVTSFQPEDFSPTAANEKFAELVHQSKELVTTEVNSLSSFARASF